MAAAFDEAQHKLAIDELKATTRVTMETVGVRFGRRVSTSIYREHLLRVPGPVILQPPSEDRVSAFVSADGGKPTCLKFFSTGKVRCLKSDFPSADEAQRSAQGMIDEMAGAVDAGMPPIRLRDAKFNENSKDFTWSTRQTIDIRRLSTALRSVGIKAESDTSFGDSIMVVITPTGTDRQIKGQVLADGTIRLAGCRDDGELAAHAVATSLNSSGALQGGGPVDIPSVSCEVWLTKRSFQVCSEQQTINMDRLFAILSDPRLRQCNHPVLSAWLRDKRESDNQFIKTINKVGTACPRLEVKFSPLIIDEWEQVRRCKPEPVSISIHNKGEVQLAGNAEYKVLQAVYYLKEIVSRHRDVIMVGTDGEGAVHAQISRTPKRKLEVTTSYEGLDTLLTPTPLSASAAKKQRSKMETPATAVRGHKKDEGRNAATSSLHSMSDWLQEAATPRGADMEDTSGMGSAEVYHNRQLIALAVLRSLLHSTVPQSSAAAHDAKDHVTAHSLTAEVDNASPAKQDTQDDVPSSPSDTRPLMPTLLLPDSESFNKDSAMKASDSSLSAHESPPVSPTGLGSASAALGSTNCRSGRNTPISPAKVATKAVRRRNKTAPGAAAKKEPKAAEGIGSMMQMPAHANMMMGMPAPGMHWMPWPHPHPAYPSPWVATLTNIPTIPQQQH